MNKTDKNPNYRKMYQFVKAQFDKTSHFRHGPFDETYYTMRVYESAKEIMRGLGKKAIKDVNPQKILAAAILHDVGKIRLKPSKIFGSHELLANAGKEWHKHARLGMPIAKRFLKKAGHSDEFISGVLHLIENHDLRGDKLKARSLELKILQDADLIADIGFAGFIRPFLYSGKFRRSVIGAIEYIAKEDRTREGNQLNLAISKKIAKREMDIQHALIREISKEIESDLI